MLTVAFRGIPLGETFRDTGGEWCTKTSETTARDDWCAPGFSLSFGRDDRVQVTEYVFAKCN